MIERDHRRVKALRLLHALQGQMLDEQPYPHELDGLLNILDRAVQGRFLPEEAYPCQVTVAIRDLGACLATVYTEYATRDHHSIVSAFREEIAAFDAARSARRTLPYDVEVSVPRIPRGLSRMKIPEWLRAQGREPADIEEACAYLAVNRAIHANEGILCLDTFDFRGKDSCIVFMGREGRSWIDPREIAEDAKFDLRWRVFARAVPSAATP